MSETTYERGRARYVLAAVICFAVAGFSVWTYVETQREGIVRKGRSREIIRQDRDPTAFAAEAGFSILVASGSAAAGVGALFRAFGKREADLTLEPEVPNKAPEPTTTSVMPRANEGESK